MEQADRVLNTIRMHTKELALQTIKRIDSGQNNDVWLIDSAFIFRFPKYKEGIRQSEKEAELLKRVAGRLPLKVPVPLFWMLEPAAAGKAFMGYRKIEGEPLEGELLERMNDANAVRWIASQLAEFLKALHGINLDNRLASAAPVYDPLQEWKELYERLQNKLYRFMKPEARVRTDRHFADFFAAKEHVHINPSLIHGDFGGSNILYDPVENKVTGVIDFGSAQLGDPAIDYAALSASYGEDFLRIVAELNPDIHVMMERVRFYKGTFALQEALFGLEHGDDNAFRSGLTTVNGDRL
jgi:aminoglycoside 2''-phosphotransferase